MPNPQAEALKSEGNNFFKAGKYSEAIAKYDAASEADSTVPAYQSNAAACWEKLGNFEEMEKAARKCIAADKSFVKGYFRLATALKNLNDLSGCIKALESGLAIQSTNADLKRMKKEVTELQRAEQVASYCKKADEQMMGGDVSGAYKTLELASRLDAGNADIVSMMSKVKPKYEAMEAKRKRGLSSTELHKEKGDEAYKAANFEGAIEHYGQCIEALKKEGKGESELILKAYSNRAACYKQISNFDGTIEGKLYTISITSLEFYYILNYDRALDSDSLSVIHFLSIIFYYMTSDCTAVLEVEPENIKALIRRAQAFEGVERYRFALQDCKSVLTMPYEKIGKANYDLCNMMQHRLNRTVQQLKKMG